MQYKQRLLLVLLASVLFASASLNAGCGRGNSDSSGEPQTKVVNQSEKEAKSVDIDREIARVQEALKKDPENDDLHSDLASLLHAKGDTKGFFSEMDAAVRLAPNESLYRFILAKVYREEGRNEEALENALAAARLESPDPRCNMLVGDLLQEKGEYMAAEQRYEKALAQFSVYGVTRWDPLPQDTKDALAVVQRGLAAKRPTSEWILNDMPWVKFMVTEDSKLVESVREAIADLEPKVQSYKWRGADVHYRLGGYYAIVGRTQDAMIEQLAAIELNPDNGVYWQLLGEAYLQQNRLYDAARAYEKSCDLGIKASCTLAQKMQESIVRFQRYRAKQPGRE